LRAGTVELTTNSFVQQLDASLLQTGFALELAVG
jgi:hypothetical protein